MSRRYNPAGRITPFPFKVARLLVAAWFLVPVWLFVVARPMVAQVGSCTPALGEAYLDISNVRARIFNNGGLFYRGEPHVYEVPKGGGAHSLFAGGVWIGGLVDNELRVAASRYGPYEFWAGPLDENGNPPADCTPFDKIWKVSSFDLHRFDEGGVPTVDLATWPTGLGAPTLAPAADDGEDNDRDGRVDEPGEMKEIHQDILQQPLAQRVNRVIDLGAGERPAMIGDQMLWWIMNDRGNVHRMSDTSPIGLEVHATAFAFNHPGHIGNTTFYKVGLHSKVDDPLEAAYIMLYADPDLGNFQDDYVGSDTTLGMGFVYNSDNLDESAISGTGYGAAPPALGYDLLQGPVVPSPGDTAVVSGKLVPDFRNLGMTSFVSYNGSGSGLHREPTDGADFYYSMQGQWAGGEPIREGNDGIDVPQGARVTTFMFPGDPVTRQFWSEVNYDGDGSSIVGGDRRVAMSTGPFSIAPGDQQEIVYGIVWARGSDHLDSITELREADKLAQAAADVNFTRPLAPAAPTLELTPLDGQVALEWSNPPTSNNHLDSYREFDPLADPSSSYYVFEGYEIYQFVGEQDEEGKLIAVYDIDNGVTSIIEDVDGDGINAQTAFGNDSGVHHVHRVSGLTNYQTYHFGVRGYVYNVAANPQVYHGPFARASVVPAAPSSVISEAGLEAELSREEPDIVAQRIEGISDGSVSVDVVNAAVVRDCEYRVEFYALPPGGATTYDVYCDDEKVFDGSASREPAAQRENVFVIDGLAFSIVGPEPDFKDFLAVANGAGPLNPPDMGAYAFGDSPFPHATLPDQDRPIAGYQQSTSNVVWGIHAGGARSDAEYGPPSEGGSFLGRAARGSNFDRIGVFDYEMRFTAAGGFAWRLFEDGEVVAVPFELWRTGIATPDDPSDDVRLLPAICEGCGGGTVDLTYDIGGDHPVSEGADDPATDWTYWYEPTDMSPGQSGYDAAVASDFESGVGDEVLARIVLVALDAGSSPPYPAALPEEGTIFRLVTKKPSQPGDVFAFSTSTFAARAPTLDEQKTRLDEIGIAPNPYRGSSAYEVNKLSDEVRLTNLPDVATIRVFTLSGTLVRTMVKDSPGIRSLSWDLTTDERLPLGSGMYLIHVDVPGIGEHVIKFGVLKWEIDFGNTIELGVF